MSSPKTSSQANAVAAQWADEDDEEDDWSLCPSLCGSARDVAPMPPPASSSSVNPPPPAGLYRAHTSPAVGSSADGKSRRAMWRSWSVFSRSNNTADSAPWKQEAPARKTRKSSLGSSFRGNKLRVSSVDDKRRLAAEAAKSGRLQQADQELLLDRVREAFDEVAGTERDTTRRDEWEECMRHVLAEMARSELASDALSFILVDLAAAADEANVEEFAAYVRRFEPWAEQRKLLRERKVDVDDPSLVLEGPFLHEDGGDRLVLAAVFHCCGLTSISVTHAKLHNSTLSCVPRSRNLRPLASEAALLPCCLRFCHRPRNPGIETRLNRTLAQGTNTKLTSLDLTGTTGFSDLGIKALAAYCLELRTLRVAGCSVTADGLTPVVKNCPKLELIEVTESERLNASLAFAPAGCSISRVPLQQVLKMTKARLATAQQDEMSTQSTGSTAS